MKILVVHRQKQVVEQIKSHLENRDFAIKYLESGLDGLFTARVEKFDLIICGTELPVVTGFELVRSVRTYSLNRTTPVIFLADELDYKTERLGHALGVAATLPRNQTDDRLPKMVSQQFSQWLNGNPVPPAALN